MPSIFNEAAEELKEEFVASAKRQYSRSDFGAAKPESFPPCMAKIYVDLMAGVKAPHSSRFVFATFLNSIGMSKENIIEMYRQTPNFNERLTQYQVNRIAGKGDKGYSSPGCDKMRSYNLCVANCKVNHPVQYYSNEVFSKKEITEEDSEKNSE